MKGSSARVARNERVALMTLTGLLPASSHSTIVHIRLPEDGEDSCTYLEEIVRVLMGLVEACREFVKFEAEEFPECSALWITPRLRSAGDQIRSGLSSPN